MQSTVKGLCLAALLLVLVARPAVQAQQGAVHATSSIVSGSMNIASDDSKTGAGTG